LNNETFNLFFTINYRLVDGQRRKCSDTRLKEKSTATEEKFGRKYEKYAKYKRKTPANSHGRNNRYPSGFQCGQRTFMLGCEIQKQWCGKNKN
jgi:hypothetical protein